MKVKVIGGGKTTVGIVGCVHGDELIGKKIIDCLIKVKPPENLRLKLVVANEAAMKKDYRFVESDLNRSFKGNQHGTMEERLAYKINKELSDCDYVIDLHSTHAEMESIVITTTGTFNRSGVKRLINCVPIRKIVIMNKAIGGGRSLIDSARAGVSVELNKDVSFAKVFDLISESIKNLSSDKASKVRRETFKAVKFVDGPAESATLHNFVLVNKGEPFMMRYGKPVRARYGFYPIFVGEIGYKDKVCIATRKVG